MNNLRSTIVGGRTPAPTSPLVTVKKGSTVEGDNIGTIPIERNAVRSANHRDDDRHRLAREIALVTYKDKRFDVDLVNLSGGGAMIEASIKPRLWDRVDLHLGEGSAIECAVRWLRGGRIGLEFAHETHIECAPEQRDALLLDVIRRSFPDLSPTVPMIVAATRASTEPVGVTRRSDVRHPMIWNGTILWRHDAHNVRLRNISASGVLVDAQVDFPEGVEVLLDLGASGQFFATVGWARSGQAGLVFREPFDLAVLAAAKPDIAPQRWDRPAYLNLTSGQASPWESEWDRRDLSELRAELEGFLKY